MISICHCFLQEGETSTAATDESFAADVSSAADVSVGDEAKTEKKKKKKKAKEAAQS